MTDILPRYDRFTSPGRTTPGDIRERTTVTLRGSEDRVRLAALRAGNPDAISRFLADSSATVWTACRLLCGHEAAARSAFGEIMAALRANHFARLAGWSGHGTLDSFVALLVRDLLAERTLRLISTDREHGWRAFESLFQGDITRLIRRRLPPHLSEEARRDAYQDVCLALIENDYRRLKSYGGTGSFAGFVLRMVDRLLIDHLRGQTPRRRLPAAVARFGSIEQEIFKLVAWRKLPQQADILAPHLASKLGRTPDKSEIENALARIASHAAAAQDGIRLVPVETQADTYSAPEDQTPEARLAADEERGQLDAALAVLAQAMSDCPDDERLYLTLALGGAEARPAREIAGLMKRPVEDIYKLKQRVVHRLRDALAAEDAVKIWRASV